MKTNYELRLKARQALKKTWGMSILAMLIFGAISFIIGSAPIIGTIVGILVSGPLMFGMTVFFITMVRKKKTDLKILFSGFNRFIEMFLAQLLIGIFTFLWSLLFIIPGIIASFSYSMTFFILHDQPKLEPLEAIRKSKILMKGKKWKLFTLYFSFFGWFLLSILTVGVGFVFLAPYIKTAEVQFYEEIKGELRKIK
ncbi:DUF975 family protein [Candidatus Woesearchaeota archaeon]|nr:DUF975 family protein [Candidatus Woesearchaeota archaeon]